MREAQFYQTDGETVTCSLCTHRCRISPNHTGICGVRQNRDGILYALAYSRVSAEHVDPVEKKPLFHFLPGSLTYSVATVGCNFKCLHCQNYSLSQTGSQIEHMRYQHREPEEIVESAVRQGCESISYTYSEPTVFFEFAYDCACLARKKGLKNVFVSNGYMTPEAAQKLAPVIDAINIDIKAFTDEFYVSTCGGRLQPVLDNVKFFAERGVLVEATTLIIPGLNDGEDEVRQLAEFIASVNSAMAWHVSAFRPTYKMTNRLPTSASALIQARQIGLEAGLKYVYIGNVHGGGGEDTVCPSCRQTVISRHGFAIDRNLLKQGACPFCNETISGYW